jgi:hypothetical protein
MMVILEVTGQEPPQMALMQDHHVVQALATDTPDEPLHVGILPGTSGGSPHVFDAHMPHPLPKGVTVDPLAIAEEIRISCTSSQNLQQIPLSSHAG